MKTWKCIVLALSTIALIISCKPIKNNETGTALTDSIKVPPVPDWVNNAVFYQIYPQTFRDTDGDGIGDLRGITEKLEYVKDMGFKGIWLNPFYLSPFRDAGYDVADYYQVAPRYGTMADAEALFEKAHQLGLKVIVDFVPGHTSIDHPWFKESAKATPNKYSNWYIWTNCTWFPGMENYSKNFVQGYSDRDGNFMTNFFWHQPALNYGWGTPDTTQPWQLPIDHPDVLALREELKNILRFWLNKGADGFRIDMAGSLVKNDPDQKIRYFWHEVRAMLDKEYPDAFIISEWSHPTNAINAGFHADFMHWFDGYNSLFQMEKNRNQFSNGNSYFDSEGHGDIEPFLNKYLEQLSATYGRGYISVPFGNHDLIRIRNNGRSENDMRVIFAFLMTMPGVPFVYYGDEIGMKQLIGISPREGAYYTRAGARTPMQWSDGTNKGFSEGKPTDLYFPVDTSADAPNVKSSLADTSSLLHTVKQLIQLRTNEPALTAYGLFRVLYAQKNAYPFIYSRNNGSEEIIVILNPSGRISKCSPSSGINLECAELLMGSACEIKNSNGQYIITSPSNSYSIYKLTKTN